MIMGLAACGASDPIGGAAGGVPGGTACQNDFTPERVAAGENCDPNLNRTLFCPLVPGSDFVRSRSEVIPCDGVEISTHPAAGGGLESDYIAIRPSSGGTPSAVYLNLHYLGANVAFYGNLTRMTELAKARNVVVLLPQAPWRRRGRHARRHPAHGGWQQPVAVANSADAARGGVPAVSRWRG